MRRHGAAARARSEAVDAVIRDSLLLAPVGSVSPRKLRSLVWTDGIMVVSRHYHSKRRGGHDFDDPYEWWGLDP